MPIRQLFGSDDVVGIFRGFREGGLEFHADIVLPYRNEYQRKPMLGQFLLVQLETPDEAVLGRIASFSAQGRLSSSAGEEFNIRAVQESRQVPEDLREQYLRYRVNIRVLGVARLSNAELQFVPSHRRLPHVGSPVAFPSGQVLQELAGHNVEGAEIGFYCLGEYAYADGSPYQEHLADWIQTLDPRIEVKFPVSSLVARRTFVFARAGFGKSNLNKLLFSRLYSTTPTVTKRDREVPVGTIIFDPEGEYFWPDDRGRPGFADVPELEDKLVVFSSRQSTSPYYQSFVASGIRLDLRQLRPSDVISIALSPEQQSQQNVRKLSSLPPDRWERLVEMIFESRNQTPLSDIMRLLDLENNQEAEALAARANMTRIVGMLHDSRSRFLDMLFQSLRDGKLCVVDVSRLRTGQALVLSGIILRRIFDHNQTEFTEAVPATIPTIAVLEEAQAVLQESATAAEPYISWVKEGRKYDLGALMITQQPGSIPNEILSQGDNWFVFHLLSGGDLGNVKRANAHFSDDLLSSLLNEAIEGHGVFWSSVGGKPYPVPIRALLFERMYDLRDPDYDRPVGDTYARQLRAEFAAAFRVQEDDRSGAEPQSDTDDGQEPEDGEGEGPDARHEFEDRAINALEDDEDLMEKIRSEEGVAWGALKRFFLDLIPEQQTDRDDFAYRLVQPAMDRIFGPQGRDWHSFRNNRNVTYVRLGPEPADR